MFLAGLTATPYLMRRFTTNPKRRTCENPVNPNHVKPSRFATRVAPRDLLDKQRKTSVRVYPIGR